MFAPPHRSGSSTGGSPSDRGLILLYIARRRDCSSIERKEQSMKGKMLFLASLAALLATAGGWGTHWP